MQGAIHIPLQRRTFVTAAAAFLAFAHQASAATESLSNHHHGVAGVKIPGNKPVNLTIRILDGPDFALQDHRGMVVVLNFFATWCPACQDEAHDVAAFAEANSADMIVVDVYYREDDTTVRAWRKKYAIALPIAMDEHGNFFHNIGSGLFSRRSSFVPTERCRAFDPVQFPPTIWPKNEHRHSSSLFPIARDSTLPRSDGPHRAAAHSSYRRAEDTQVGYVRFEGRLARRLQY